MNGKFKIVLGAFGIIAALSYSANAQLPEKSNFDSNKYSVSGESLSGIENISASSDFNRFFTISNESAGNTSNVSSNLNSSVEVFDTPIILRSPNTGTNVRSLENFNSGNDGVRVEFDFRDADK